MIVGGDFNLAAHSALDRSRVVPSSKAFPKSLNRTLNNLQLVATWRAHNVGIKAYTFYSHPHDSFACLDYIFFPQIILANSSKADIHSCPWSDHHIVSFTTSHIGLAPTPYKWRINDSLLTDHTITQQLTTHLEDFFAHNTTPDMPPNFIWMAHKAVMRGHLINIASANNKSKLADIKSLTKDLDRLYNKHNQSPSQSLLNQIHHKRIALDTLLSADTEKALSWTKAKFLLYSNSSSTMFARKLNQSTKPSHVYKLRNPTGNLVSHPKEVLEIFSDFYKKLLSTPQTPPKQTSLHWLEDILLPTLSSQKIEVLNAPCSDI